MNEGSGRGPGTPAEWTQGGAFSPPLETELELCQLVNEALGRFGVSGRVSIEGREIRLDLGGRRSRAALPGWLDHWPRLDDTIRKHRATELARQLAQSRSLDSVRSGAQRSPNWTWLVAGLSALVLGGAAYLWLSPRSQASAPAPTAAPVTDAAREREARNARVCEDTRARVLRGATVGTTETDGWVVEIWGMQRGGEALLAAAPALGQFVEDPARAGGSQFIWKDEPELAKVIDSSTRVTVSDDPISGSAGRPIPALRVTFHGNFVEPYFDPEQRSRFYHIANGLAAALQLTHVGVYARCEAGRTHHLGSWFRGLDDGGATVALLYSLGTYAEPPHLAGAFLHAPGEAALDRSVALENIERASTRADRSLLAGVLGRQSAMITGKRGDGVVITFPFRDGHRASRASRELARLLTLNSD